VGPLIPKLSESSGVAFYEAFFAVAGTVVAIMTLGETEFKMLELIQTLVPEQGCHIY